MAMDQLSQDEIDALIFGDSPPEEDDTPADGVIQFDFNSHDKIIRGRMPTLEMINERFARLFRISMFGVMSKSIDCAFGGLEVMKFQDFIRSLYVPTSLNLMKINPLRGRGLLVFDSNLIYTAVENFFGGDGRYYTKIEGRDFTDIELSIITMMRDGAFKDMEESWKNIMPIGIDLLSVELNPQFANIVSPSEAVIVSRFDVELDGGGGGMYMVMPYSMIEPIKEILQAGTQTESLELDERWSVSLKDEIGSVDIEVSVDIGSAEISFKELAALDSGDIIPFKLANQALVRSEGVPIFTGKVGLHNGNFAVQAVESIKRPKGSGVAADSAMGEIELF